MAKSLVTPEDMSKLSEEDQRMLSSEFDKLLYRDGMMTYNSMVERCFNDCVDNFTRKELAKQEVTCVRRCVEKFLRHSMRVNMRFSKLSEGS